MVRDRNRAERPALEWHCRSPRSIRLITPGGGSFSKLNTWRDGFRILGTILNSTGRKSRCVSYGNRIFLSCVDRSRYTHHRHYLEQGVVPRLPTAILSMGLMILAVLSMSSGLVLER